MNNLFQNSLFTPIFLLILISSCQPHGNNSGLAASTAQETPEPTWSREEAEVKATVERFLIVAGNYDLEAMDGMILDNANLGISRFREGAWETSVITINQYFENTKTRELRPYFEPVSQWVIHINEGQLAFVWADAILNVFGVPVSHNSDFFTLIKEDGNWKFLNLSFTTNPLPTKKKKFDLEIFAKSYAQAWSGRRPEFVAKYFDEDGSLRVNDGDPAKGREEISKVAQGFMTDLPDMVVSFDSLVSKSNGTEFHWTLTATNSGPGGNNKNIKVSGFELWQIGENGLIQESQGNFPTEEYNRQLEYGMDN